MATSSRPLPVPPANAFGGAITIGNFDGVHRGHRQIIRTLRSMADSIHGPAVVVTFDPPPSRLLRPELAPQPLTTTAWKTELLQEAGVDAVLTIETDLSILQWSAKEFFQYVLVDLLKARGIVEGQNFRFGKDRGGDVLTLQQLALENHMACEIVRPELESGDWVSSTRIRQSIEAGDIHAANSQLLRQYRMGGIVVTGAQRGRTIGFPTANLEQIPVLVPAVGVYAARVVSCSTGDGVIGKAVALHIGPNPTFGEEAKKVEAHLRNFTGDLYGSHLELELLAKIRDVVKFQSKEALLEQLQRDVKEVDSICQTSAVCGVGIQ